jgi:hypothetical protein
MSETQEPVNKPVESFSVSGLSVSLWENKADNDDGSDRTYKSVTIRKSYFSRKENQLTSQTLSLTPVEVSCLVSLLRKMEDTVIQKTGQSIAF